LEVPPGTAGPPSIEEIEEKMDVELKLANPWSSSFLTANALLLFLFFSPNHLQTPARPSLESQMSTSVSRDGCFLLPSFAFIPPWSLCVRIERGAMVSRGRVLRRNEAR